MQLAVKVLQRGISNRIILPLDDFQHLLQQVGVLLVDLSLTNFLLILFHNIPLRSIIINCRPQVHESSHEILVLLSLPIPGIRRLRTNFVIAYISMYL